MKNKERADNMLLHARLGSAGMPGEKGRAAVCLGRIFLLLFTATFFSC